MTTNAHKLELTKEEMRTLGYKAIDELVEHFDTQNSKLPVAEGSREDMDKLFLEDAPEEPTDAMSVLNFVVDKVMSNSNIVSHPKSYSFVPGPSNYVSTIADTLATGFNEERVFNKNKQAIADNRYNIL